MIRRLVALGVLLVAVLAGGAAWWVHARLVTPYRGFAADEVFVDLPAGVSVSAMATRLVDAGIVPDAWTFRLAARLVRRRPAAASRRIPVRRARDPLRCRGPPRARRRLRPDGHVPRRPDRGRNGGDLRPERPGHGRRVRRGRERRRPDRRHRPVGPDARGLPLSGYLRAVAARGRRRDGPRDGGAVRAGVPGRPAAGGRGRRLHATPGRDAGLARRAARPPRPTSGRSSPRSIGTDCAWACCCSATPP